MRSETDASPVPRSHMLQVMLLSLLFVRIIPAHRLFTSRFNSSLFPQVQREGMFLFQKQQDIYKEENSLHTLPPRNHSICKALMQVFSALTNRWRCTMQNTSRRTDKLHPKHIFPPILEDTSLNFLVGLRK